MFINKDYKEFIELLNKHKVEYLIIGAYAVAFHSIPRFTGDIDFLINVNEKNAEKMVNVINDFGFSSLKLTKSDFLEPFQIIQLGHSPIRIDIITGIKGLNFNKLFKNKIVSHYDDIPAYYISCDDLIETKKVANRDKDKLDIKNLRNF